MKEFLRLLFPLKRKLMVERFCQWFLIWETIAGSMSCIVLLLSKFYRVDGVLWWCGGLLLCGLLVTLITVFFVKKVTAQETATTADACGGAERMITTMELLQRGTQNEVEALAVADGFAKAKEQNFAKQYRMVLPKKWLRLCGVVFVTLVCAGFVPIQREPEAKVFANAKLEKIEQVKEEAQKEMTKEEKQVFAKTVKSLEQELKQAKTQKQAENAIQQAQQEMKKLEKQSVFKDLQALAETLKNQAGMEELAKQMEKGDSKGISAAMQQMLQQLQNMSAEQKVALAQALSQTEISDAALQEILEQLQEALENGEDLQEVMNQLQQATTAQANANANLRYGLQKMNQVLAQNALAQSNSAQNQAQSEGDQSGAGGEGNNGQQGAAGMNGANGNGGAGIGPGGNGRGTGHLEAEKVFTRNAANKADKDVQLQGTDTEQGQTTMTEHHTMGEKGESVPYDTVYQQYRNDAMRSLEEQNIPYGMKTLVSDYFSTLE